MHCCIEGPQIEPGPVMWNRPPSLTVSSPRAEMMKGEPSVAPPITAAPPASLPKVRRLMPLPCTVTFFALLIVLLPFAT